MYFPEKHFLKNYVFSCYFCYLCSFLYYGIVFVSPRDIIDSGVCVPAAFGRMISAPTGFPAAFARRGGNLPPAVRINSGALRSLRFRADGIRPYGFSCFGGVHGINRRILSGFSRRKIYYALRRHVAGCSRFFMYFSEKRFLRNYVFWRYNVLHCECLIRSRSDCTKENRPRWCTKLCFTPALPLIRYYRLRGLRSRRFRADDIRPYRFSRRFRA